jgi:hypothetical protein
MVCRQLETAIFSFLITQHSTELRQSLQIRPEAFARLSQSLRWQLVLSMQSDQDRYPLNGTTLADLIIRRALLQ